MMSMPRHGCRLQQGSYSSLCTFEATAEYFAYIIFFTITLEVNVFWSFSLMQ